ncbi:MAG TPA: UDP-N-acetylglucosamine 2-epimerase (non-hydrolyzing) [Rhizomicrobium sp.]|jgi:UDP-GlcNAc3NAcA epimerase|nr:UDP-N-acetylglucosamine 2-epimerase (non-hydrolyzing) [Rhizomicrobium sp.]
MAELKRVVTIAGARPQFVKAFALSRALAAAPEFEEILVHTGQHFDENMSGVFFDELNLPRPKYRFALERSGSESILAQMLGRIERILASERPDAVIIFGDTDSTLAGALAASRQQTPLVHIEAGMRSFNRTMPEEINRVVADHVSDLLLCVTATAVENLAREGIAQNVHLVGDLMYDATLIATQQAEKRSDILERLALRPGAYGVATVHRAGNTDDPERLRQVLDYVFDESRRQPIVFPVHPRTIAAAKAAGLQLDRAGIIVTEPLGYLDMSKLVHHAGIVLTDSGGLQKEAYFYRVPCVTLRDETEWVETIAAGWNRLWTVPHYAERREITEFGSGDSGTRIVERLRAFLLAT